ncbi:MAG: porin family protein [Candidatus Magnetoovum sp. WYHC-5]|nr:porin family protein [Candidatus Magnetoovum sp. WYHC-5]
MKKLIFIICLFVVVFHSAYTNAQEKKHYIALRPGLYFFTDEIEEKTFIQTGFSGEFAYGYYLHPNFGLEFNSGYYHDGVKRNDVRGFPAMLLAKGYYTLGMVELYTGGGFGIVYAEFDGDTQFGHVSAEDVCLGGNAVVGTNFNVLSNFFVGAQGKYIFTDQESFDLFDANLNGFTTTISLGYRF